MSEKPPWKQNLWGVGLEFERIGGGVNNRTELGMAEGILLGHAMVQRLADALGVRAFFIKGPPSVVQGLRRPKESVDIDVFVEFSNLGPLLRALQQRGWEERPMEEDARIFPTHSATLHHPNWPCCIDVHFCFPGMEEQVATCFEIMWTHTVKLQLAGQEVRVPSKLLGILILALHALRAPHLVVSKQDLEYLGQVAKDQLHVPSLIELAAATGSLAAVRPFLEPLLTPDTEIAWPEQSIEWRTRIASKEAGSARLIAVLGAPWRAKIRMLVQGVFPPPEAFLNMNIYADMTLMGRLRQHGIRWRRFLSALPRTLRDIRKI